MGDGLVQCFCQGDVACSIHKSRHGIGKDAIYNIGVSVVASVSFVVKDSHVWLLKRWDSGTECRVLNGALVARFRVWWWRWFEKSLRFICVLEE